MEDISDVYLTDFVPSVYTSPCTMYYKQNEKQRKWHIFAERNGVVIILYNSTRDVLILKIKTPTTAQIAKEEILEECGYDVAISHLEQIGTIKNLSVTTGARSTFYYCEVTDEMRVSKGGGEEGENVEVVEMPTTEVINYATNPEYVSSPVNFMYGLYWFLYNKYDKSKNGFK
ncbi:hypothetical protein NQ314_021342 [Rhamnusium bicolor]|uniref:Nudix hydrolase domain-containing protein n=1 Tax=Rhamnusium bicolor TaxID=1586634 RepID=A0AAV8WJ58_9CUCU|nr:hypothetical protein NQ314_021342 [Rhamnusium bicolor]